MPKQKTNRGAMKRFKVTGGGGIRRAHAMKSHILTKKANKRKRRLRKGVAVDKADIGSVRKMLNR
jgi:large subunit ribosomal protein L35